MARQEPKTHDVCEGAPGPLTASLEAICKAVCFSLSCTAFKQCVSLVICQRVPNLRQHCQRHEPSRTSEHANGSMHLGIGIDLVFQQEPDRSELTCLSVSHSQMTSLLIAKGPTRAFLSSMMQGHLKPASNIALPAQKCVVALPCHGSLDGLCLLNSGAT